MPNWKLLSTPLLASALLFGACGDGPDGAGPDPTATSTVGIPEDFGPAPILGGNILVVNPEHAASVPRSATGMPGEVSPRGVCVEVTFEGLPQSGQWFRMAVDGEEVTASSDVYWFISAEDADGGTMCYAPAAGLEPGKHTAAVSVQDPNNPAAETRQIIGWAFEVTP